MESMSSNLNASLPFNVAEDAELTDLFKDGALAITSIFKHAQKSRKAAFAQGYHTCVSDLRDFVTSNAEVPGKLTVGNLLDYLDSRKSQLSKDPDTSSANGKPYGAKPPLGGNKARPTAKSPSPSSTSSTVRQKSPVSKRPSPRPSIAVMPFSSPSLSPTPLAEPAWSEINSLDTPKLLATGWPEVSSFSALQLLPTAAFSSVLPSVGAKRKRDALADVDARNALNAHDPRRGHTTSRKQKRSIHRGKPVSLGGHDDWAMDIEDEITGRERKRRA